MMGRDDCNMMCKQEYANLLLVMRGLDPRIHVFLCGANEGVDGRVKPGHDDEEISRPTGQVTICDSSAASVLRRST
jgi:tRNA G37 N-methylase TrmD